MGGRDGGGGAGDDWLILLRLDRVAIVAVVMETRRRRVHAQFPAVVPQQSVGTAHEV